MCKAHYKNLLTRLQAVISGKWPESLDGGALIWAHDFELPLWERFWKLDREANDLWLNNQPAEFKKLSTEWGRTALEIHQKYAQHLKQKEAA